MDRINEAPVSATVRCRPPADKLSTLSRSPGALSRFRVTQMEKKAMAAVMASRGCAVAAQPPSPQLIHCRQPEALPCHSCAAAAATVMSFERTWEVHEIRRALDDLPAAEREVVRRSHLLGILTNNCIGSSVQR